MVSGALGSSAARHPAAAGPAATVRRGSVVIVSGPPGAGKSTVAEQLAARYPRAVRIRTDAFWHAIVAGGTAPYLPESNAQNQTVVRAAAAAAFSYADGGYTVVLDGVIGPWMLDHYRARHAESDRSAVRLHYVVLRPARPVALQRAQSRSGSDALRDAAPIIDLWDQFADLGTLEAHAIDSTHQTVAATVDAVAEVIASGRALVG